MVIRRVLAPRIDFGALRRELGLPDGFPAAAQREADEAADAPPRRRRRPHRHPVRHGRPGRLPRPGPGDAPQRRAGGGYRVRYAIADVAAHVRPGGPLEEETWRRGQTVYLPDGNVPLHPHTLSEGAASLLPDVDRAAVLWTIDLDTDGATVAVGLERALVRSRAKLDYSGVQAAADAGRLPEPIALLPEIGALLTARGLRRGAINLPLPEQDVEPDGDGWRLVLRGPGADGGAQRPDLPADRDGRRRHHARRPDRPAAHHAGAEAGGGGPAARRRRPAGRALAGRGRRRRGARRAGRLAAPGRRLRRPGGRADARRRVHGVRRRAARATGARRGRRRVRPCHRAAAAAGRPVRHGGLPGPARGPGGAGLGPRGAAPAAGGDGRDRPDRVGAATRGAIELAEAVLLEHRVGETFDAAVLDVDAPPERSVEARSGRPAARWRWTTRRCGPAAPASCRWASGSGPPGHRRPGRPQGRSSSAPESRRRPLGGRCDVPCRRRGRRARAV